MSIDEQVQEDQTQEDVQDQTQSTTEGVTEIFEREDDQPDTEEIEEDGEGEDTGDDEIVPEPPTIDPLDKGRLLLAGIPEDEINSMPEATRVRMLDLLPSPGADGQTTGADAATKTQASQEPLPELVALTNEFDPDDFTEETAIEAFGQQMTAVNNLMQHVQVQQENLQYVYEQRQYDKFSAQADSIVNGMGEEWGSVLGNGSLDYLPAEQQAARIKVVDAAQQKQAGGDARPFAELLKEEAVKQYPGIAQASKSAKQIAARDKQSGRYTKRPTKGVKKPDRSMTEDDYHKAVIDRLEQPN